MTAEDFKNIWTQDGETLSSFSTKQLQGLCLLSKTIKFLETVALPHSVAPYLSFEQPSDLPRRGIKRITDVIQHIDPSLSKYVTIGTTSNGDPIVVDTEDDDKIKRLNHEDSFLPDYCNESVETLAECIIAYRNFVRRVQVEGGVDSFMNSNYTDLQLSDLKQSLLGADRQALDEGAFWQEEFQNLLADRDWERNR
jgi:hypothetical protein